MSEVSRDALRGRFQNGDRPDSGDFTNLIDSCLNKSSDGLSVDGSGNLVLGSGLRLNGSAGGLRFNSGQVEFSQDGETWLPLSDSGGGFFTAVGATAIEYSGNIGINTGGTVPASRLEVELDANTTAAEQVRFGNVVCSNGSAGFRTAAQIAHKSHATNSNFALRQTSTGDVHLNAPAGRSVSIQQGGNTVAFGVSAGGRTIVGAASELAGAGNEVLQVAGGAFKNDGNAVWSFTSDARVKENVRDLEAGLSELRRVRPVRYRYNGRAGTPAGLEGVGVLGQEIEKIFPETISRVPTNGTRNGDLDDLRVFNPSALTFVLINAVNQLAEKVEQLERALGAQVDAKASP